MNRKCGDCQLCCKLLPVVEIEKAASTRCKHQRAGVGCVIYKDRPTACRLWSCRWLYASETRELRRPDRAHYVIDMAPDYIELDHHDGEPPTKIPVIQVWVDPDYRDAHRDPALRAYLNKQAEQNGTPALIRWGSRDALTLFPPALTQDGEWHEKGGDVAARDGYEESVFELYQAQLGELFK